jgi:glyoxylase-like metal-dependent hydrolase (beta-lactamase superfamily II)
MRVTALVLVLVGAFGGTAAEVSAQGRPGIDFEPGLVPIEDGVYVYEGILRLDGEEEVVRTNSLVVVTAEGVVVVDGQDDVEEGRRLLEAIRTVTSEPVRYLVNASPHGDHVNANEVFPGAVIVAHEGAYVAMAEAASAASEAGGPETVLPHVTFGERMTLRVGGRTLELHHFGRGHTRGDAVVFLPESGVAFLSELYFNGVFASVGEGFVAEHITTLERAMELPARWWIPGHGLVRGESREDLREGLDRYLANVRAIHAAVSLRVARGETLEEVLAGIDEDLGPFTGLPFYGYLKRSAISGTYRALTGGG